MKAAVRSAAPVLATAVLAIGSTALLGWPVEKTRSFPQITLLAALIIAAIGGVRQWRTLPGLPCLGMAFAGGGYAVDSAGWMTAGLLAFAVLALWHDCQHERPQQETSTTATCIRKAGKSSLAPSRSTRLPYAQSTTRCDRCP